MPKIAPAPFTSAIDPRKRFGDSPRGAKRYRRTPSGKPRPLLLQLRDAVDRAGTRMVKALAPPKPRATAALRVALRHCSHRVGDLLQVLSQPYVRHPRSIDQCVDACIEASERLALLPGAVDTSAESFIQARLEVHLQAMNLKQLVELRRGLTSEAEDPHAERAAFLDTVAKAVDDQLEQHAALAVQQLLSALAHPKAGMRSLNVLQACMQRFGAAKAALPPERRQTLSEALARALPALSLDRLKQLSNRIEESRQGAAPGAKGQRGLARIADAVHADCVRRWRSDLERGQCTEAPAAQEHMDQIVKHLDAASQADDALEIQYRLDSIQGPGAKLLAHYGLLRPGAHPFERSWSLLKDICAQFILQDKVHPRDLRHLFRVMPAATQAQLLAAEPSWGVKAPGQIDRLLTKAIQLQFRASLRGFHRACGQFKDIAADSPDRLMQQAQQLHIARRHWSAMNAYRDAHHAALGLNISKADSRAFAQIKLGAAQLDLARLDHDALSDDALQGLEQTLTAFKIDQQLLRLQVEIARRKQQSEAPYVSALSQALEHIGQGDLASALTSLQQARNSIAELLDVHRALGARANDFEEWMAIIKRVVVDHFSSQPLETLERWFQALDAEQAQQWAENLRSKGSSDEESVQIGTNLQEMQQWLADSISAMKADTQAATTTVASEL